MSNIAMLLLVLILLVLIGVLPVHAYSSGWGFTPPGVLLILLVVVLVLALRGKL